MLKGKNKIIIVIVLLICLYFSLINNRNLTNIEINIKDALTSILKVVPRKKETTNQTDSYVIQKKLNDSLQSEIKELKNLLELNSTKTEYELENANVIARNNISWLNTLTIDKGTNDGLEIDMPVITKNGLIGKISKVTKTTSEVKLLTSSDITNKISIAIKVGEEEHYAILSGYDYKKQLLKVSAIDKSISIEKGTSVITSGLGKMPQGIYIGDVYKTEVDNYELSQTLYIRTKQNFNAIYYVSVIKETKE